MIDWLAALDESYGNHGARPMRKFSNVNAFIIFHVTADVLYRL